LFARPLIGRRRPLTTVTALALVGSILPAAAVSAAPTELFFSEYIEGTMTNKALEIFNGTGAPINLATGGYSVTLHTNGGINTATVALTGTVAAGDVFVLSRTDATAMIQAQTDQFANSVVNFNGDDAISLRKGGVDIDVIGQIGFDPGTVWGVEPNTTAEHTLVRKASISQGDANGTNAFDPAAEWDSLPQNTFSQLGSHAVVAALTGVGAADPPAVDRGEMTTLTVDASANTTSTGLAVSANLGPIGGSATQALRDDGMGGDVTVGDAVFTYVATVALATPPGDKVLTATITDAEGRSGTVPIELEVTGEPIQIWEIQGAGHRSPLVGQQVFDVAGVVTAVRSGSSGGFWMTDVTPDGAAATSNGIFVFTAATPSVAVADLVEVDGTVAEFRPGGSSSVNLSTTQIGSPTISVTGVWDDPLPTTVIGVDRVPPGEIIEDDATVSVEGAPAVFDPATDGIDFWETMEGMRLEVAAAVAVGRTSSFGATSREIVVISQLQADAGIRTPRGGVLVRKLGVAGDYRPGDFNPERLILANTLAQIPVLNAGDEFTTDPLGVLDYSFGNFKLLVTEDPGRDDNGLPREITAAAGPHELAVATYNVENLSALDDDAKVDELADQIVNHLLSPDLIAIEEMQDNSGDVDDEPDGDDGVVAADQSWQRLIDAIVAAGGPLYDYRQIDPEDNADGGVPGGNIRVGFLFHSERGLEFVDRPGGDATIDTDVVPTPNGKGARLTISPGRVLDAALGGDDAFLETRKSLAGEFRFRGETIFVIANHFSSKSDDRPLFARFQPPFRFTEFRSGTPEDAWRHAQAQAINDFVDEILAVDPKANVIVLGDINDFDFSETVEILTGERVALDGGADVDGSGPTAPTGQPSVLTTLFDLLAPAERYSYVFDGNSQVLDQILVSGSLIARGPTYDVVHVNAEFADQASDHDPSVMRVAFQPRDR
jgi:predicted extracellular nuclease